MTYVDTRMNVWEALAGRGPGEPAGPVDPGLWGAVVDRLDPARARPVLRAGIEAVQLTAVRGGDYLMLRSPADGRRAGFLRLSPEEWQLAQLMDGEHTVARLVAEFARIAGRLAPDQVRRVVADLAGNEMLDELPVDAFRPLEEGRRKALPERVGNSMLAAARGRRMLVFDLDGLFTVLYRAGGRLFFGRVGAILTTVLAVVGLGLFVTTWSRGSRSLFLTGGSYVTGALVLVLLNAVVLSLHQLARALAAKAAGRAVPAAGLLVCFGIPSIFVDTSDVWMAGRRARMLVSAAGPLSALLLAGVVQMAGLAWPNLAGAAFKLAFLFYLNAFFRLSPLLPLDGHLLLTDWLEIPQLRARALAWVGGRLRGRPPRWSTLDREGRLIGLYGFVVVAWLAIAANLAFMLWSDRISELATGLEHDGPLGPLLLVVIVLGIAAPACYFLLARLSRWWGNTRQRRAEGDREADSPRRLAALRASELGGLPDPALHGLAARARWMHPPTGRQIVQAGGSPTAVYVVVEGAMAARKPGDPPGTIRHQTGPGGVVGLANVLTGRPTQLDWHTAGTSLLAVPSATVATVIGPLPGPPPQDRSEAESLFADTPALAGLGLDQRLALIASAHPVDLAAGAPVVLAGPTHAVVVESGVIALADGIELRRGTLIGPVGDGNPGMVAQTRTPTRLWVVPDAADLPPLVGAAHRPGSPMPVAVANVGLRRGAPGGGSYPPLAVPPSLPDGTEKPEVDKRFERRLRWLTLLLLIIALTLTGMNFRAGPAWAEMPADDVLLTVSWGRVTTVLDGGRVTLTSGAKRYLEAGDQVTMPAMAGAWLTFPGGAITLLCGGAHLQVAQLSTGTGRRQTASGTLNLQTGRLLADTTSTSGAYNPLRLTIARQGGEVTSNGAAWFAIEPSTVHVSIGTVNAAGTTLTSASSTELDADTPTTASDLSCGDGVPVKPPAATSAAPEPTEESFPPESASAAVSTAPGPGAPATGDTTLAPGPVEGATTAAPPLPGTTTTGTTTTTTTRPTTTRPTTRTPTTRPTTRAPTPTATPTTPTTTAPPPATTPPPTEATSAPQQSDAGESSAP